MTWALNGEPAPRDPGNGWLQFDGVQYPPNWPHDDLIARGLTWVEPEPVVLTLEQEREAFFIRVGDRRRIASQNLTFAGMSIFLDAKTEDAIHKGIKGLERSPPGATIKFEVRPGRTTEMDLTWMSALGDAGFALVQACFSHSSDLCDLGWLAETVADLREIDIESGWP